MYVSSSRSGSIGASAKPNVFGSIAASFLYVFVFTGWTMVAQALGQRRLQAWLPVVLLACMTAIPAWLAVGPGPRLCSVGVTNLLLGRFTVRTGLACRLAFGLAALACMGILLLAARQALRTTAAQPPR